MAKDMLTHAEELTLCRIHHGERFWGEASVLQSLEAKGLLRRYAYAQPNGTRWSLTKKALDHCCVPSITHHAAHLLGQAEDGYAIHPAKGDGETERQIRMIHRWGGLASCHGGHVITKRGKAALGMFKHELGEAARRR